VIVRCGRCGVQFQVPGPGRYACPSCGTGNEVRSPAGPAPVGAEPPGGGEGFPAAPGPVPPAAPSSRVACPACGFGFIVGDIALATCPNCGAPVPVDDEENP
jgi:DNA-directed RNA polymerase subunit RPC12/RpoP